MLAPSVTTPALPKLRVEGLTKRYGAAVALEPTDLSVRAGEFLTLLGPSGSGKTTLLQMICGLVEPTGGRVLVDGRDETHTPVHRRGIGLVFQNYALFPHLTVAENVGFPLKMRRQGSPEIARRVAEALATVRLEHLAGRYPRELSGGQQQRVALARCFVYGPAVILMDEPLGALDKKLREHMQVEIKRLHRQTGATFVYVTHDQEEALALSDRICLLNHARVEQLGTPEELYLRPLTAFAADFIGISNMFRGRLLREADRAVLDTPDGRLALPPGAVPAGEEAAIVVRPENLTLAAPAPGGDPVGGNRVAGTVIESVYAGAETRVLLERAGGAPLVVRLAPGQRPPQIGARVEAGWQPDASVVVP